MLTNNALTILIFLPLLGSVPTLLLWRWDRWCRTLALVVTAAELVVAGWVFVLSPAASAGVFPSAFYLFQDLPWIERFGIRYSLGLDGISVLMVLLTAFIVFVAVLISPREIMRHRAAFYALIQVMTTGIMGVFLALDLLLFYLFWEVMLLPMFLLICIWGQARPVYSALKFFLFSIAGSLLMLLAIIGLYLIHGRQTGQYTFALAELLHTAVEPATAAWLFAAFLLAFGIKVPLFPVHGWLPDAYTNAPTAGSLILAALLAKTGIYGLIRFAYPLFSSASPLFAPALLVLAVIGIVYASWIAYAQQDLKRLVAYSSFSHMGFIALGVVAWTPVSLSGSVLQMVNHGITTGCLFLLVAMLEERTGVRGIEDFGGLWGRAPYFSTFFLLTALASVGLPGLNNFVGEFLILAGAFPVSPWAAVLAFCGVVPILIYMLRAVQRVLFMEAKDSLAFMEVSVQEGMILAAFAVLMVFLGVYPAVLLDLVRFPVQLLAGGAP